MGDDFNTGIQKGAGGCLGVFLMILAIIFILTLIGELSEIQLW